MAKKSSLIADKLLIKTARDFLDLSVLMPNSKIDARKPLTKYQRGKIKSTINELISRAGGMEHLQRDFIKMPKSKSREKFTKETGLPKGTRGVMIPGGSKINKQVHFRHGKLTYKRGEHGALMRFIPLDASTERAFEKSMRDNIKKYRRDYNFLSLGTYGGEIKFTARKTDEPEMPEFFIKKGMDIYTKYQSLAAAGMKRDNGRIAAHPSRWGLGLLGD